MNVKDMLVKMADLGQDMREQCQFAIQRPLFGFDRFEFENWTKRSECQRKVENYWHTLCNMTLKATSKSIPTI